jgi:Chromo (CHRromatin Organisation MOdifier) domain
MNNILKDLKIVNNPVDGNIIQNLFKLPHERPTRQAHVSVPSKGYTYQADLLYLPEDGGFKYALVVVDNATHAMDAQPLRKKDAQAVLQGFLKIFKRKYLPPPKFSLEVDDGAEFKGTVKQFFKSQGIILRSGKPYRHRQQAVVEWVNYLLGKLIFMLKTVDEVHTGVPTYDWVADLPQIVAAINKNMQIKTSEKPLRDTHEQILPVGTSVRVLLDAPINIPDERKLYGKFRAGDIRWSVKPVKITDVFLRPDQPVFYAVEGNDKNVYTRDQLQVYNEKEEKPRPRKFIVEGIIGKKVENGKLFYQIKWKGYDLERATWEPAAKLKRDIPILIQRYEEDLAAEEEAKRKAEEAEAAKRKSKRVRKPKAL